MEIFQQLTSLIPSVTVVYDYVSSIKVWLIAYNWL
jgi:hypothetical protein